MKVTSVADVHLAICPGRVNQRNWLTALANETDTISRWPGADDREATSTRIPRWQDNATDTGHSTVAALERTGLSRSDFN